MLDPENIDQFSLVIMFRSKSVHGFPAGNFYSSLDAMRIAKISMNDVEKVVCVKDGDSLYAIDEDPAIYYTLDRV